MVFFRVPLTHRAEGVRENCALSRVYLLGARRRFQLPYRPLSTRLPSCSSVAGEPGGWPCPKGLGVPVPAASRGGSGTPTPVVVPPRHLVPEAKVKAGAQSTEMHIRTGVAWSEKCLTTRYTLFWKPSLAWLRGSVLPPARGGRAVRGPPARRPSHPPRAGVPAVRGPAAPARRPSHSRSLARAPGAVLGPAAPEPENARRASLSDQSTLN